MNDQVSFGYETIDAAEKTGRVGAVFSSVASRYDVMNDAMSAGLHRLWKDQFVRRVKPREGEQILDMAGGTGDIAFRLAKAGARVTVSDINQDMLDVGIERAMERGFDDLVWSRQNAEELTFPDRFFDAYTIAFGIRNVANLAAALAEARRVLRPGGRLLVLEFSRVRSPALRSAYDAYSFAVIPRMGALLAGDRASYRYLVESIRRFPDQEAFAAMIGEAGFERVASRDLSFGIAALHSAWVL